MSGPDQSPQVNMGEMLAATGQLPKYAPHPTHAPGMGGGGGNGMLVIEGASLAVPSGELSNFLSDAQINDITQMEPAFSEDVLKNIAAAANHLGVKEASGHELNEGAAFKNADLNNLKAPDVQSAQGEGRAEIGKPTGNTRE